MDPIPYLFFSGQNAAAGILNVGLGLLYSAIILSALLVYERVRSVQRQKRLDRDKSRIAALMRVQARKDAMRITGLK